MVITMAKLRMAHASRLGQNYISREQGKRQLSLNASVLAYPMRPRLLKKKSARCGGNLSKLKQYQSWLSPEDGDGVQK